MVTVSDALCSHVTFLRYCGVGHCTRRGHSGLPVNQLRWGCVSYFLPVPHHAFVVGGCLPFRAVHREVGVHVLYRFLSLDVVSFCRRPSALLWSFFDRGDASTRAACVGSPTARRPCLCCEVAVVFRTDEDAGQAAMGCRRSVSAGNEFVFHAWRGAQETTSARKGRCEALLSRLFASTYTYWLPQPARRLLHVCFCLLLYYRNSCVETTRSLPNQAIYSCFRHMQLSSYLPLGLCVQSFYRG